MHGPDLATFFAIFPSDAYLASYAFVDAGAVPEPYRTLLVHEHHMTVTVEDHHHSLVDVVVEAEDLQGDAYSRKILLRLQSTGELVMFGLVRIHLQFCSAEVRAKILSKQVPLGRILIENQVMRRIEPTAYLRIEPGPEMQAWFDRSASTYGRLAFIHCDGQPAIELLEVVRPELPV